MVTGLQRRHVSKALSSSDGAVTGRKEEGLEQRGLGCPGFLEHRTGSLCPLTTLQKGYIFAQE